VTNADDCGVPVFFSSPEDIGGFQFNVEGVEVTGASGGAAEDAGFTVSTSATTVLGFSFSGATIPTGSGLLTFLETADGSSDGCLYDVVISGSNGNSFSVEVSDCNTLVIEGGFVEPVYGCTDEDACNYDADANTDNGTCEYIEDCTGICGGTAEFDCAGICDGDAEEDDCGVCGGDGEFICWDGTATCDISNCPTETNISQIFLFKQVLQI
jgi:hypothetical protein